VQQPVAAQIDHPNTVVLELSDEQVLARKIERQMINAPVHCPKRNLALKAQDRSAILLSGGWDRW